MVRSELYLIVEIWQILEFMKVGSHKVPTDVDVFVRFESVRALTFTLFESFSVLNL